MKFKIFISSVLLLLTSTLTYADSKPKDEKAFLATLEEYSLQRESHASAIELHWIKEHKTEEEKKRYDFAICDTKINFEKSLQYIKDNPEYAKNLPYVYTWSLEEGLEFFKYDGTEEDCRNLNSLITTNTS